ncbi:siphovirus ReqiPepy6 Gp37-like family protein [Streptomyces decoyicus]|uniref:siphovirus ReqiPepy6 Gp37-like family protein n=1 Tax=Streptomyces decoyicus TaxID=249567 RepID=UPI003636BF36
MRDRDLNRIGEIDTWLKLDLVVRYCQAGSWTLLIKAGTPQADLLQKGGGVAIYQDGVPTPVLTGPIESIQHYWTVEQHTEAGSLYVGGACDNKLAYSRLAFPNPTKAIGQQYSGAATRTVSGKAGTQIWKELSSALGPTALDDRKAVGVDLGTVPNLGGQVDDSLRFDVLGTKFEDWIDTKNTGWRFVYDPNRKKLVLDVFQPRDRSADVRFSKELGNLREYIWTLSAPTTTRAIVACQGDGAERYIYQKINTAAEAEWGLVRETFIDRRDLGLKTNAANGQPMKAKSDMTDADFGSAKAAVIDAADSALNDGAPNGNFQIYPIDTPQLQFGKHYFVGDIVTVVADGVEYSDLVREVDITVEDGGKTETVAPKIGEQGTGNPLNLYKTVFEMREKLRKLEARM